MKKKYWMIPIAAAACVVVILCIVFSMKTMRARDAELLQTDRADIVSVSLTLNPPGETVSLTEEEIDQFVTLLHEIRIYGRDGESYVGQAEIYQVTLADGSEIKLLNGNPVFTVGKRQYKTEYEPAEALNQFANGLFGLFQEE